MLGLRPAPWYMWRLLPQFIITKTAYEPFFFFKSTSFLPGDSFFSFRTPGARQSRSWAGKRMRTHMCRQLQEAIFRCLPMMGNFQRWPGQPPAERWAIFPYPLIWTGHVLCFGTRIKCGGSNLLGLKWLAASTFPEVGPRHCVVDRLFCYRERGPGEWRPSEEKRPRGEDTRLQPRASARAPDRGGGCHLGPSAPTERPKQKKEQLSTWSPARIPDPQSRAQCLL